jgi:cystathionine beta-lyase/cystathionine gamma-synthase
MCYQVRGYEKDLDICALSRIAHELKALSIVDNTLLSPVNQRLFELDADIIVHSTTKYLNGHSDVVGGAVAAKEQSVVERLRISAMRSIQFRKIRSAFWMTKGGTCKTRSADGNAPLSRLEDG